MKKWFSLALSIVLAISMVSCDGNSSTGNDSTEEDASQNTTQQEVSEPEETLDLTGEWVQTNSNSEETVHGAYITEDTIEVYWVMEDTTALYWAGTFTAPDGNPDTYTWTSENDTDRTSTALLASADETKEFTYTDGVISYEASAMGATMTVELERGEWGYSSSSAEEDTTEEPAGGSTEQELSPIADVGEYHVEIKGGSLTTDYEGNTALVVTYAWTNNSEDTTSAMTSVSCTAFQDGIELESAIIIGDDSYDSDSFMTEVRPGTTLDIQVAFVLPNTTSLVEVEVGEWLTFEDDPPIAYMEIDPSTL